MVRTGEDKYTFNKQAVGGEMRGQTVTVDILNSGLQKVNVAHPCHDCKMETPTGSERPEKVQISRYSYMGSGEAAPGDMYTQIDGSWVSHSIYEYCPQTIHLR